MLFLWSRTEFVSKHARNVLSMYNEKVISIPFNVVEFHLSSESQVRIESHTLGFANNPRHVHPVDVNSAARVSDTYSRAHLCLHLRHRREISRICKNARNDTNWILNVVQLRSLSLECKNFCLLLDLWLDIDLVSTSIFGKKRVTLSAPLDKNKLTPLYT